MTASRVPEPCPPARRPHPRLSRFLLAAMLCAPPSAASVASVASADPPPAPPTSAPPPPASVPASSAASPLTPAAARLIAPIHAAFVRVQAAQAAAGPPRTVSDRLLRLGAIDQAGRNVMQLTDLSPLPPAARDAASRRAWDEILAHDAEDRAALVALLPPTGWFTISGYGADASEAAWEVVQHQTDDPPFMAAMLERMAAPAKRHDVDPHDYALLFDRVAMLQHRDQEYGSQFQCRDHRWVRYALRDPAHVEDRRRALGLSETAEQVEARVAAYPPCYFSRR